MNKYLLSCLALLLLCSWSIADILPQTAKVGGRNTSIVEFSSRSQITLVYRNNTGADVYLDQVELNLLFNNNFVDEISFTNEHPYKMKEVAADWLSNPGKLTYKLVAGAPGVLKVTNGSKINLVTFNFHLTNNMSPADASQILSSQNSFSLFSWDGQAPSKILFNNGNVLGITYRFNPVTLKLPTPPVFTGLNSATSASIIPRIQNNPGKTILLNWRNSGPAVSGLSPYNGIKYHFQVWRATKADFSDAIQVSPDTPVPYLGNIRDSAGNINVGIEYIYQDGPQAPENDPGAELINGQPYYYRVYALSDTSPVQQVNNTSPLLLAVPTDQTPSSPPLNLSAVTGDKKITLFWTNPDDAGGNVIIRGEAPLQSIPLGGAIPPTALTPAKPGPMYMYGQTVGAGQVVYSADSAPGPQTFEDPEVENGKTYYYQVFTYDSSIDPMGFNYSKGASIGKTPGIQPFPPADLEILNGNFPGEYVLKWKNSTSDFAEGVLIRYGTSDYPSNEKVGVLAVNNMNMAGPSGEETYSIQLEPGQKYYFTAFAYNSSQTPLDPESESSLASHLFSSGTKAVIDISKEGALSQDVTYTFIKLANGTGVNTFALPTPITSIRDQNGQPISLKTLKELVEALDQGKQVIRSLGWWDETVQKPSGITKIEWPGPVYTCSPGVTVNDAVFQGRPYQLTISDLQNPSAALTHIVKFKIVR